MSTIAVEVSKSTSYIQRKVDPISTIRLARWGDLPKLKRMVQTTTTARFGCQDLDRIFHLSRVGVVATTASEEIVACIFVDNSPNIPSIPPWDWVSWIRHKYNMKDASPTNTLFMQTVLYHPHYSRSFLPVLLTKLFDIFVSYHFIILVVPPKTKFLDWTRSLGTAIGHGLKGQYLMVYLRQDFVKSYKLRKAVPEDNDDLVPLIDRNSKRLKQLYGDYYVAEIISNDKKRHVVVAEYEQKAVAVMVFNEDLNYDLLNEVFQVECFNGLKKTSTDDYVRVWDVDFISTPSASDITLGNVPPPSAHTPRYISAKMLPFINPGDPLWLSRDLNELIETLTPSTSSSSSTSSKDEPREDRRLSTNVGTTLYGLVDARFSCHALHFHMNQLEQFWMSKSAIMVGRTSSTIFSTLWKAKSTYKGPENAFALEIIASEEQNEDSLLPLLAAGFELFPNKDYCVLCIPPDAPNFQLLSERMVRVSPMPASYFPQELYVVHRNSIRGHVTLTIPTKNDILKAERLVKDMRNGPEVMETFRASYNSKYYSTQCFVAKCDDEVVGVANLRDMTNLDYIAARYQLAKVTDLLVHKPGCVGELVHFVLSPIFLKHSKFLLRELHRLSDYSILFYIIRPEEMAPGAYRKSALACVLADLTPVLPSKVPEYTKVTEEGFNLPITAEKVDKPYAVYISTPMYCGLTKLEINNRIVVVGASEVGISFLLNLIFNRIQNYNTVFSNVTLVSTHGFLGPKSNYFREVMIPQRSETVSGYHLALLSLATFVNVVEGVVSLIDRKKRAVQVNSSSWVCYDMLFLTCGLQRQMPLGKRKRKKRKVDVYECPENVFVVNTDRDVDVAMETLSQFFKDRRGNIIVYGNCMEAYCCVEALLGSDVKGLIFVEMPDSNEEDFVSVFDDENIEKAVKNEMEKADVKMYKDYEFYDWTFGDDKKRVVSLTFSGKDLVEIPCMAAFMYGKETISKLTFEAINGANLIYDGGLVVDDEFRTNDPNIFAAGKITKYPRRYYADHMKHEYFNQTEIGKKMAGVALKILLPSVSLKPGNLFEVACTMQGKSSVPRYRKPVYVHAMVPRKLEYFHVKKPGFPVPMDIAMGDDDFGRLLTTGSTDNLNKQGYFKLHLNQYDMVETIQALSQNPIDRNNLYQLWGKHESMLNNLVRRFDTGMISDLFEFFSGSWSYALYLDGFQLLQGDLTSLLISLTDTPGTSLIEDILDKIKRNNFRKLTNEQHYELLAKLNESSYREEIEKKIMHFLTRNIYYLPMYLTPATLNLTLGAYENSPLFKEM